MKIRIGGNIHTKPKEESNPSTKPKLCRKNTTIAKQEKSLVFLCKVLI
jgi:ubiquitin